MSRIIAILVAVGLLSFKAAPTPESPDPESPRPIDARDTVFIEEMTWMEVRDALRSGHDTLLIATGGVEQNGPYLATGKHNYVLRATTEAIARRLGKTLVAPIVPFVPEGDIQPPTGHMRYPGTISLQEETFEKLLEDICASFRTHGFKRLILIGDSGGNQEGMKVVAERLNAAWTDGKTRVSFIPEYYDYTGVSAWLESQGIKQVSEGLHDDFAITAIMLTVDPNSARHAERVRAGKASINGVSIDPLEKAQEWGRKIVEYRATATVNAIQKSLAAEQR